MNNKTLTNFPSDIEGIISLYLIGQMEDDVAAELFNLNPKIVELFCQSVKGTGKSEYKGKLKPKVEDAILLNKLILMKYENVHIFSYACIYDSVYLADKFYIPKYEVIETISNRSFNVLKHLLYLGPLMFDIICHKTLVKVNILQYALRVDDSKLIDFCIENHNLKTCN